MDNDCSAHWAGLTFRAEEMDINHWCWAVFDDKTDIEIASSNDCDELTTAGEVAIRKAELAGRNYVRNM